MLHFVECPVLCTAIADAMPLYDASIWPGTKNIAAWIGIGLSDHSMCTLILRHDLVQTCFYDARHSSSATVAGSIRSRVRQVVRRAPNLRDQYR